MEINKQEEKTFTSLLCETKLNLVSVLFAKEIKLEIEKLNVAGVSEFTLCQMVGYEEGLKKALEIYKEIKNK